MPSPAQPLKRSLPSITENRAQPSLILNKCSTSAAKSVEFVAQKAFFAVRYWPVAAWSYFVLPEVIEKVGEAAAIAIRSGNLYSGIIESCSHLCKAALPSILKTVTILALNKIGHAGQRT